MPERKLIKITITKIEYDLLIEALEHAHNYTEDNIFKKIKDELNKQVKECYG